MIGVHTGIEFVVTCRLHIYPRSNEYAIDRFIFGVVNLRRWLIFREARADRFIETGIAKEAPKAGWAITGQIIVCINANNYLASPRRPFFNDLN